VNRVKSEVFFRVGGKFKARPSQQKLMGSVPPKPPVELLFFQEDGVSVETLVDCGSFRYHLLVERNYDEDGCEENALLEKVDDALRASDDAAVDEARDACMALAYPLMFDDYQARISSHQMQNGTIKLRAVTSHGVIRATEHDRHIEYPPTKPVENEYPDVETVSSANVEVLEEIDHAIQKVKVNAGIFCLKSVHRKLDVASFKREIQTLRGCSHPNIVRLFHLVTDEDNMVEAMLLEYIPNARLLSKAEPLLPDQYTHWTEEIRDAIQYLHSNNLVWGDAKPGNILIRGNDSIVLVDFGGGYTEGWVDSMSSGTTQGDWEGYEKIVQYLAAKVVDLKSSHVNEDLKSIY